MRQGVRAELVIYFVIIALIEQIKIKVAQNRPEGITIKKCGHVAPVKFDPEAVRG